MAGTSVLPSMTSTAGSGGSLRSCSFWRTHFSVSKNVIAKVQEVILNPDFTPNEATVALEQLDAEYQQARQDPEFQTKLSELLRDFVGRPSPLYFAENLTRQLVNTDMAAVELVGLAVIIYAAIGLMVTIENSFNIIC